MKSAIFKIKAFATFMLVAVLSTSFVSCSDDDDPVDPDKELLDGVRGMSLQDDFKLCSEEMAQYILTGDELLYMTHSGEGGSLVTENLTINIPDTKSFVVTRRVYAHGSSEERFSWEIKKWNVTEGEVHLTLDDGKVVRFTQIKWEFSRCYITLTKPDGTELKFERRGWENYYAKWTLFWLKQKQTNSED